MVWHSTVSGRRPGAPAASAPGDPRRHGTRIAFRLLLKRRLWETEQYYQAMNEWRSVLGQDPGNLEARLGLARAAAKAGDRAAAAQEYLRILQIVPDQPDARRELARLGRAAGP
jgi:Tfp pilus assembly protein PilF